MAVAEFIRKETHTQQEALEATSIGSHGHAFELQVLTVIGVATPVIGVAIGVIGVATQWFLGRAK